MLLRSFGRSSARRSGMPRRGWQTVEVPAGWFEVIRGRRPQVRRVDPTTAQRFSFSSARSSRSSAEAKRSTTVSSCKQREAHPRRRARRTCTRGEVGSRHRCRGRVGSYFPGAPRGSQTSTTASTGATSGEPDQVFVEARGESTLCEGQGCRRRIDIDLRVECIAGRRIASCSPLGRSIEDRRVVATHDVAGRGGRCQQARGLLSVIQRILIQGGVRGWQHEASSRVHRDFLEMDLFPRMNESSRALVRSQAGPGGVALSTSPHKVGTSSLQGAPVASPPDASSSNRA